ncbi:MAG: hypothetical protein H6608_10400 [Flavobacteriales bacterium]|nr:hypothetical protein [Bacteroidota bacterium]MCB9241535.1 hypothetical protein [Flavobacteriales bacterium]
MSKRLAKFLSIFGHPVFLPVYGVLAVTQWHFLVAAKLIPETRWIFVFAYILSLTVIPLIGVALMLKKYTLDELSHMSKEERISASGVLAGVYLFMAFAFRTLYVAPILQAMVIALGISALVLAIATRSFRISFHSFGWAGLTVLFFIIGRNAVINMSVPILVSVLLGALVMTSRLVLGAHQHREVYAGYIIGLICNSLVYLIYFNYGIYLPSL